MVIADTNTLWLIAGVLAFVVAMIGLGIRSSVKKSGEALRAQNRQLHLEVKNLKATQGSGTNQEADLRKRAVVEALYRAPALGEATDPASRRQLQDLVDDIVKELQLADEIAELNAEQAAATQRETLAAETSRRIREAQEAEEAQLRATESQLAGLEDGFYVDPLNDRRERFWDGERWDTETYPRERRTPFPVPPERRT